MEKIKGFSLVELLISLVVISVLLAAFVPTITKKMSKNIDITTSLSSNVPLGTIVVYLGQTPPDDNWLICDGSDIPSDSKYNKLRDFLKKDTLPDFRGYVIKGADDADIARANE